MPFDIDNVPFFKQSKEEFLLGDREYVFEQVIDYGFIFSCACGNEEREYLCITAEQLMRSYGIKISREKFIKQMTAKFKNDDTRLIYEPIYPFSKGMTILHGTSSPINKTKFRTDILGDLITDNKGEPWLQIEFPVATLIVNVTMAKGDRSFELDGLTEIMYGYDDHHPSSLQKFGIVEVFNAKLTNTDDLSFTARAVVQHGKENDETYFEELRKTIETYLRNKSFDVSIEVIPDGYFCNIIFHMLSDCTPDVHIISDYEILKNSASGKYFFQDPHAIKIELIDDGRGVIKSSEDLFGEDIQCKDAKSVQFVPKAADMPPIFLGFVYSDEDKVISRCGVGPKYTDYEFIYLKQLFAETVNRMAAFNDCVISQDILPGVENLDGSMAYASTYVINKGLFDIGDDIFEFISHEFRTSLRNTLESFSLPMPKAFSRISSSISVTKVRDSIELAIVAAKKEEQDD